MNIFKNGSLCTLLLAGAALTFTSCKKDKDADPVIPTPTPSNVVVIDQPITASTEWTANHRYLIKGFVHVEAGATLTIAPGTVIFGDKDTKGTLIVKRGARIDAAGTPSQPIVFTSAQPAGERAPGDWGGIILCGRSTTNLPGGSGLVEGGVEAEFGGSDGSDDSGRMSYVRIEFPGIAFQENNEINGLTLAGVGSATQLDHIQVSYSGDDSFEWFGGTVNAKHLVAFAGLDDDLDMDNGFSGSVQFALVLRDPRQADVSGSNGLEHDNDATGTTSTPITAPVLSNITILGPLVTTDAAAMNSNYKRAAHLRRNTRTKVFNSVFTGFPTGLLIDGGTTETNATNNDLRVRNTILAGMTGDFAVASGSTWDISTWFSTAGWGNATHATGDLGLGLPVSLTSPQLLPEGASPLMSGADFSDPALSGGFFQQVSHRGAFGTTNWTSGWTNWDPQNTTY